MEKAGKIISRAICWLIAAAALLLGFYYLLLPGELSVPIGSSFQGAVCGARITPCGDGWGYTVANMHIKPVELIQSDRRYVVPGGTPFGIKLRTEGVLVVSVNRNSPADRAGLRPGDVISSVNGVPVQTNSEISSAVQLEPSQSTIVLSRGSGEMCMRVQPEQCDGVLRLGAWVRDSAAGIGTMTFYEPESMTFAGLGHPVSDVTTGGLMPLSSGEITDARIYSVIKGKGGEAGELCGELCAGATGKLLANTPVGVFGEILEVPAGDKLPVAFRQEVECGPATILATLEGTQPQEYSIEIEKINLCALNGTKSMVIRVTDQRLLENSGGIVRGMSGSPIIQNGMLAGAVTHVFINDPTRGYAVFAESMTERIEEEEAASAASSACRKNR